MATPDLETAERKLRLREELTPVPIERMKALAIFAGIPDSTLKKIQQNVFAATYEKGETILREGDYSDTAYYIASGVVQVHLKRFEEPSGALPAHPSKQQPAKNAKKKPAGPAGTASLPDKAKELLARRSAERALGRGEPTSGTLVLTDIPAELLMGQRVVLESGELFGEISALSRYPVSATVVAERRTECLLIRTPALRLLERGSKSFKKFLDTRYRERSLKNHLKGVSLFADCDPDFIDGLMSKVELVSYEPGQVIVEEGASGDAFFLVRGGYVKVGLHVGGSDVAVTYLRKGDYAGEVALLLSEPWPFTLSALEHVELVKLTRDDFKELLRASPAVERALWEEAVSRLKARGRAARDPISAEYLQMAMETGLIHGESVLLIDLDTCTRCDDCVRACADTHEGTPRFIREGLKYRNWLVPTSCYECTDPVCMIGCPTGAITRPVGTAEVVIDPLTCIGCGNCVRRCPWDNIVEVPFAHPVLKKDIKLATKCDQCIGRHEGPACVQMCPHGSAVRISFKDFAAVAETLNR